MALDRPDILLEQGYPIMREAHARNRRVPLPGPRQFERWVASYFSPRRGLVLAALRHNRLLAFNTNLRSTASPTATRPTPTPRAGATR